MRTLRIESGGKMLIGGESVDLSKIEDKPEFLSSLLTLDVELADDLVISDLIHFFYESKSLIKGILSEEYEVVRALVTTTNLPGNYKQFRIFKSFKIEKELGQEEEFIYLLPDIELIPSGSDEEGVRTLSSLSVVIDENIELNHNNSNTNLSSKTKISLLDVMTCLFEDLSAMLKQGTFSS